MGSAVVVVPLLCGIVVGVMRHHPGAGVVAFYLALLAEALGWAARREWLRRRMNGTLDAIDAMDGVEFEDYVATRLVRAGWEVRFTPPVGDYGVDLIAEKGDESVAVQCKRYGKPVGVAAVQQVVSGARLHGCARSIVVSNQEFTSAARKLAFTHRCQLIGRGVLQSWVPPPAKPTPQPGTRIRRN
ncbi:MULTISPECIES: restriction endonuclease [Mycobacterium]|uniref:restriction endonuclease n=1 Tax=Mycobacterium TaxID=1763 RepID=UPI001EF10DBA|nr:MULTISPECIES: restriction endonuclease [Mycobacterium]BDB41320.1 hypothetical protein IWGMT90018_17660 [Mycobacterium kiyosense]BDE13074.1 hypothetical protein MKCMC460_19340 [Mycobacterium sp. 20KCMC460]GLC07621.1 hypothetical protein SRL2020411_22670 [Mycobacterium kiyosense]GLC20320.1 hypothetical protein SRL2020472_28910 [Mycobacterium kiyosense]GLC98570.1 hypothetical protein Mkiyose1088_04370 [Mycobacterium kiyosense]